jgi:hypothetical protein
MRALAWAAVIGTVLGAISCTADKPEDLAQAAALSWLEVVDKGAYEASWDQSSELFKRAVTRNEWRQAVTAARPPLGKLVSRKVKSRRYTEKVQGAPDGRYVVIQFDTVFEKKPSAVETVTPMLDPDGVWRISGYFIR